MKSKVAKKILEETPKETKQKARDYANKLIERKCVYCKCPTSGINISYCDRCLLKDDYSN